MMHCCQRASRSAREYPFRQSWCRRTRMSKSKPRRLPATSRAGKRCRAVRPWSAVTSRTIDADASIVPSVMNRAQARTLLSAEAVRRTAHRMLALAHDGELDDWLVDFDRLPATADFVVNVVRERYPRLDPPLHARWRHFVFEGRDLGRELIASRAASDTASRARAAFDLAITSVLLDAGAGPVWRYLDAASGLNATRSEGLALASLRWFASGGLSDDTRDPLRADAAALLRIDAAALDQAFQAGDTNPLAG